jgi:hypothetical protein
MPKELTQTDLVVLQSYSDNGDRKRYWSYLKERGDPYAKLALGVVLNTTLEG